MRNACGSAAAAARNNKGMSMSQHGRIYIFKNSFTPSFGSTLSKRMALFAVGLAVSLSAQADDTDSDASISGALYEGECLNIELNGLASTPNCLQKAAVSWTGETGVSIISFMMGEPEKQVVFYGDVAKYSPEERDDLVHVASMRGVWSQDFGSLELSGNCTLDLQPDASASSAYFSCELSDSEEDVWSFEFDGQGIAE